MLAAATVIRYDATTPQFAIFGTRVICVFYSIEFFLLAYTYLRFIYISFFADCNADSVIEWADFEIAIEVSIKVSVTRFLVEVSCAVLRIYLCKVCEA